MRGFVIRLMRKGFEKRVGGEYLVPRHKTEEGMRNITAERAVFLLYIKEILGSNIGRENGYAD
jgi:hypothetical protein